MFAMMVVMATLTTSYKPLSLSMLNRPIMVFVFVQVGSVQGTQYPFVKECTPNHPKGPCIL